MAFWCCKALYEEKTEGDGERGRGTGERRRGGEEEEM
jgi:hypothetical protein